jgi:hypothetical protein
MYDISIEKSKCFKLSESLLLQVIWIRHVCTLTGLLCYLSLFAGMSLSLSLALRGFSVSRPVNVDIIYYKEAQRVQTMKKVNTI